MPEILSIPTEGLPFGQCPRSHYYSDGPTPTILQCQYKAGHDGLHGWSVRWSDPRDA